MCNVLVPWTNPSPARGTGVHCGTAKGPLGFHSSGPMTVKARVSGVSTLCWGLEGIYRSSLDARKPQNPINSEGYLWHLQGVLYIV